MSRRAWEVEEVEEREGWGKEEPQVIINQCVWFCLMCNHVYYYDIVVNEQYII